MTYRCCLLLALVTPTFALPTITKQPLTKASVSVGANLNTRVTAVTTNGPLRFQWKHDILPLLDATDVVLSLTNIQINMAGTYTVTVLDNDGAVTSAPFVLDVDPTFTRITSGPVTAVSCSAAAWADVNNDGFPDVYLTVSGGPNVLCLNNGDGNFRKAPSSPPITSTSQTFGCAWADYDNDGFADLFRGVYNGNDELYRNNGNGTFTLVKAPAMPASGPGANNCAWADYDNDGFVDVFAANGFGSTKNTLMRNKGDGTFVKVTDSVLLASGGNCLGAAWADYDNDGRADLVITRNRGLALMFHNEGNGNFSRATNTVTLAPINGSFAGPSWGDFNNDGYLDLFLPGAVGQKCALFRNDGNGSFTRMSDAAIAGTSTECTGGAWADYDNDGYLDLFAACHHGLPSSLFHNNGDGTFTATTTGSLSTELGEGQGAAWADYDNNGFPDLLVPNIRNGIKNYLYRNNGNSNNWLSVHCVGGVSNRSAIGAKVRVFATINGKQMWQLREISGGDSLGSQGDFRCLFGLGDATNAEIVRVEWPSGIVQQIKNVAAKQFFIAKEPPHLSGSYSLTLLAWIVTLDGVRGDTYTLQRSTNLLDWTTMQAIKNESRTGFLTNSPATQEPVEFFRALQQ
jgi:hypothetical protein